MSAFNHAWGLLKALSTEDLQQAARTGGIGMTPERRQAYTDAGLPLNTGGGFRTIPETEAQRIMRYQKTGSHEAIDGYTGDPKHPLFDPRHKADMAERLHQDDTGGNLDMDDRLLDEYFKLTQGDSIEPRSEPEAPPQHPAKESMFMKPIPRSIQDLKNNPDTKTRFARRPNTFGNRMNPGRIRIKELEAEQERAGSDNRGVVSSLREQHRRFDREKDSLPEGHQGPERFPLSEFARRGDAGTSASDKAFSEMKLRQEMAKERAEAEKQMLAERQKEMMMSQQRGRIKSNQPPKGRAGGRRPGEGKNAYNNRMRRQGGRR